MSNPLTAKAALLVIATAISFSSPTTNANAQVRRVKSVICFDLPEAEQAACLCGQIVADARVTCDVLLAAVSTYRPADQHDVRSEFQRLCVRWKAAAKAECLRSGVEAPR